MRILGIDPGTRCGWAILDGSNRLASGVWDLSGSRYEGGGMRYLRFERLFRETLPRVQLVAFEEVRRHLGPEAAHVYGGIIAILEKACEEASIPYLGIPVGTVKKMATGKGNADKDAMQRAAVERWGGSPREDEADALWIAAAAEYEATKVHLAVRPLGKER